MDSLTTVQDMLRLDYAACCFMVAMTSLLPKEAWLPDDVPYYSNGANREAVRDTHGERIEPMREAYKAYLDFGGNRPMLRVHALEDAARRRFMGKLDGDSHA